MAAFDKKQMDAIVNRFLGWKLPSTFGPDAGVRFTPSNGMSREEAYAKGWWPVGTNLLNADEAREMLEHVLDVTFIPDWSLLEATQASLREHMAMMKELRAQLAAAQVVADHLFIDERGDGPWLVCVEKVFDTEDEARAACRKWQAATGGVEACAVGKPHVVKAMLKKPHASSFDRREGVSTEPAFIEQKFPAMPGETTSGVIASDAAQPSEGSDA